MSIMKQHIMGFLATLSWCLTAVYLMGFTAAASDPQVVVETQKEGNGDPLTKDHRYVSHVTLYLDDKERTPSGWSTRKEHGAPMDKPFAFQPGVNLIQGWTTGVLQMKEGERAFLHVPAALGYGERPMGSPNGGGFYIPANSDLLFDIEIVGKEGEAEL